MIRRPPRSTRTYTLFPYTTLFRSVGGVDTDAAQVQVVQAIVPQGLGETFGCALSTGLTHQARDFCGTRSEEHTSELQSLMRISYAVFCLKKKNNIQKRSFKNSVDNNNIQHRPDSHQHISIKM